MFHKGFTPETIPLFQYLLVCVPVVMIFFSAESRRAEGVPLLLSFALPWGLAFQFISFGLVMPLYCLAFVLTGAAARRGAAASRITEGHAMAIFAGFTTAAVISLNVFYKQSPYSTVVWQFFPLWAVITQQVYLLFSCSSATKPVSPAGHGIIRAAYLVSAFASAYVHLVTVVPLLKDTDALKELFMPVIDLGAEASMEAGLKNLIKWDMVLGMGALQFSTLWFARSSRECVALLLVNVVGTVAVGPGGVFSGIMMWREGRLARDHGRLVDSAGKTKKA